MKNTFGNYIFHVKPVVTAHRFNDVNQPLEDIIDANPVSATWCNHEVINACSPAFDTGICPP